jgi:fructose-1,6-bisphosphatase/inositol monophosphatase family enzyme
MKIHMTRTCPFAAIAIAGLLLAGCGGDDSDDDKPTTSGAQQDARVAQRLEAYLKQNTKDVARSQMEPGGVISFVEVADGQVRVITYLNADLPAHDAAAGKLCRAVEESRIVEAKGAAIVDAGAIEIRRC